MASFDKSEDIGYITGAKMLTFRAINSNVHTVGGIYSYLHGLFDFVNLGYYFVFDIQEDKQVLTESEAHLLGFESKEDYFSHNFNGFNCDDATKTIAKHSILNLDVVYGFVDELDDWIDSVIEAKEQTSIDAIKTSEKWTDARMADGSILTLANSQ